MQRTFHPRACESCDEEPENERYTGEVHAYNYYQGYDESYYYEEQEKKDA